MAKKPKQAPEEPRIYIIVPETVQVTVRGKTWTQVMEPGRLMAQCAHVARKMENAVLNQAHWNRTPDVAMEDMGDYQEVTTIVLSVRNSLALARVLKDLEERNENIQANTSGAEDIGPYTFEDYNPEFYGTKKRVLTAVCTAPIERWKIAEAIDYLELYGA